MRNSLEFKEISQLFENNLKLLRNFSKFIKSSEKKISGYNRITEDGVAYSGLEVIDKEFLKKKYGKLIINKPFKSI